MSDPCGDGALDPKRSVVVDVLAPVAVDTAYSYRAPAQWDIAAGQFVVAPLGRRHAVGVVWATREGAGDNLKSIAEIRDLAPLRKPLRDFIDWVARWTLAPRGMVLRMATRAPEATAPPPPHLSFRATGKAPLRLTPARARVLAALVDGAPLPKAALAEAAGCGASVIDGLVDDGALEVVASTPEPATASLDPDFARHTLEPDQCAAAEALTRAVEARAPGAILLEGVTGSGKTEVYFEAVAAALRAGRQALVLLPEIALTSQFLDRFAARFGARPAEWHSAITPRQRERLWVK